MRQGTSQKFAALTRFGMQLTLEHRDPSRLWTLLPSRLSSRTEKKAFLMPGENKGEIDGIVDKCQRPGRDGLFINDISMPSRREYDEEHVMNLHWIPNMLTMGHFDQT